MSFSALSDVADGCRIEVAVKHILSGINIQTNASVANPESLEWFREWAVEKRG